MKKPILLILLLLVAVVWASLTACTEAEDQARDRTSLEDKLLELCLGDRLGLFCETENGKDEACCSCWARTVLNELSEDQARAMIEMAALSGDGSELSPKKKEELQRTLPNDRLDQVFATVLRTCEPEARARYDEQDKQVWLAELEAAFDEGQALARKRYEEDAQAGASPADWAWSETVRVGEYRLKIVAACGKGGTIVEVLEDPNGPMDPNRYPLGTSFIRTGTVCVP